MPSSAEYFCRNQGALTADQQQTLQQKRVAVIGCGGLGGYVIEELVRIGVGRLHVFDPDVFTPSNCNRQLNALTSTMDQNKAAAAAHRSAAIHPFTVVHPFPVDFREITDRDALRVDALVDCLDSAEARRDLAALGSQMGLPLVHGAVNGWCGQVGVQLPGGDLIDRLYPARTVTGTADVPSVLSFTVAVVASLQAAETVKLLLGLASPLHNNWMHIDLKNSDFLVHG